MCVPSSCEVAKRERIATVGAMPLTLEEIVEETMQWPVDAVAELLDRVALAKHGGMSAERMDAWTETALRRCAELNSGQAELIPGEIATLAAAGWTMPDSKDGYKLEPVKK